MTTNTRDATEAKLVPDDRKVSENNNSNEESSNTKKIAQTASAIAPLAKIASEVYSGSGQGKGKVAKSQSIS